MREPPTVTAMAVRLRAMLLALAWSSLSGCSSSPDARPATETDAALARPAHWISQPAVATVTHNGYDQLWEACHGAARWRGFRIDRADYRGGLIVSHPLTSKQAFEVWRRDVVTLPAIAESTLATMRRTARFEITEQADGSFACVPKVVIERYSSSERRITSVTQYRESFSIEPGMMGSRERDRGIDIPITYWYATGRDEALERELAAAIRGRLPKAVASR